MPAPCSNRRNAAKKGAGQFSDACPRAFGRSIGKRPDRCTCGFTDDDCCDRHLRRQRTFDRCTPSAIERSDSRTRPGRVRESTQSSHQRVIGRTDADHGLPERCQQCTHRSERLPVQAAGPEPLQIAQVLRRPIAHVLPQIHSPDAADRNCASMRRARSSPGSTRPRCISRSHRRR